MDTTQQSLLGRLQQAQPYQVETWNRFVAIYAPLLDEWTRRLGVPVTDRSDVVQDTLVKLLTSIASFRVTDQGSFRGWLFTVMRNSWMDSLRKRHPPTADFSAQLSNWAEPDPGVISEQTEYRQYLLRRVHDLVTADFPLISQQAFQQYVMEGKPASFVAKSLGLSTNAVYLIRVRILRRIREELAGLLDE